VIAGSCGNMRTVAYESAATCGNMRQEVERIQLDMERFVWFLPERDQDKRLAPD